MFRRGLNFTFAAAGRTRSNRGRLFSAGGTLAASTPIPSRIPPYGSGPPSVPVPSEFPIGPGLITPVGRPESAASLSAVPCRFCR